MLSKTEFAELTDWSTVNEHSRDALIAHDREQRAEIERLKRELARMKAPPQTTEQSCPQCGPGVSGDEDGCCIGCGSTLCGAWVTDLRDPTRVRDARVEAPKDDGTDPFLFFWSGDFWESASVAWYLAHFMDEDIRCFFWLPQPPAPEVAK